MSRPSPVRPSPAGRFPFPPPFPVVRRLAVLLYGVAVASSQVAVHAGAVPVAHLRLFEALGLVALASTALVW